MGKHQKTRAMKEKVCEMCGVTYASNGGRSKYCLNCRVKKMAGKIWNT